MMRTSGEADPAPGTRVGPGRCGVAHALATARAGARLHAVCDGEAEVTAFDDKDGDGTARSGASGDGDGARRTGRRERRRRVHERRFDDSVPSPCIQVCQLDEDDLCLGCRRHVDEIRDWPIMTAEEKRAALDRVAARKSAGSGPDAGG